MGDSVVSFRSGSRLYDAIVADSYFDLSDAEALQLVHDEFPDELDRLKRAYSVRDAVAVLPSSQSPSQLLYGEDYDEINRTLVSVLALRWVHERDYEGFVRTQPHPIRLAHGSFDWICELFHAGIDSPADVYALLMSVVINDLGKDPQLASDYTEVSGEDISRVNHDMILLKAVKAGLVRCLSRLELKNREDLIMGMELGAELNFGQLAQAENTPACLSGFLKMKNQPRAFLSRFMEQILDVAGAGGHMDWTCAKKMIEPVYQAYHNVYDVAQGIISENMGLRDGYDVILERRATLLRKAGFRIMELTKPEDRAIARILCMGGVSELETANIYDDAFLSLDRSTQHSLIHSLNLDGSVQEPAVQPTYMPAMLSVGVAGANSEGSKKKALQSLLRYLSRVLAVTTKPPVRTVVIERNVRETLGDILGSVAFKEDPDILETVPVPTDEFAKSE